jgi:penicillin-insensitive murein endopeptidase
MSKNLIVLLFPLSFVFSCEAQPEIVTPADTATVSQPAENPIYTYVRSFENQKGPSQSKGAVSGGSLVNGRLMPFSGPNFQYFDTASYLGGRAFVHEKVQQIVVDAYAALAVQIPGRQFYTMECSQEHGGKMFPHKTHQNGTSVDFMMPKLRDGKSYYHLDSLGAEHYWLSFDENGRYSEDTAVVIDFEAVAQHLILLDDAAKKQGYEIGKVIFKMEMKDELLATPSGQKILQRGIYITKNLSPLVNALHDEHYHVDFVPKPKAATPNKSK